MDQARQDCSDVLSNNLDARSGVYGICALDQFHEVYCDEDTNDGGWTVCVQFLYLFSRRISDVT